MKNPWLLYPSPDSKAEALQARPHAITETNRIELVLTGMLNRTSGPYLAAISRILVSLWIRAAVARHH
jgi:hypothetical protein